MQPKSTNQPTGTITGYFFRGMQDPNRKDPSLCIHLAGNNEVKFYAPVADRANSDADWEMIRASVQAELQLSLPPPDEIEMEELTGVILNSVVKEEQPPSFKDLTALARNTQKILTRRNAYIVQLRELDRQLPAATDGDFWARTMPAAPVTSVVTHDLHLGLGPMGPIGACDSRFDLHMLEQFLRSGSLGDSNLKTAIEHLQESEVLQHAFTESCSAILHEPGPLPQNGDIALVRLLWHVQTPALDLCFLSRTAFDRLCAAQQVATKDVKGLRPLERDGTGFLSLQRNMERYEACMAAGAIPPSLAKASRRFVVEMIERLEGRFQPLPAPDEGFLLDRVAKVVSDSQRQTLNLIATKFGFDNFGDIPEAHTQNLFGTTCQGNLLQASLSTWAEATPDQRLATANYLMCLEENDVEHVYVDKAIVLGLRQAGEAIQGLSDELRKVSRNLRILEDNAREFDACSKSEVFHNPAFDDVPLELFVPWWIAMQSHFDAPSQAASSSSSSSAQQADPVVFHAASNEATSSPEPSPEAPAPAVQVEPRPERKKVTAPRRQHPETKEHELPRAGGASIPVHVHVPLTPNTNKGPGRTGREWWNALKQQTHHHLPGKHKHLPKWMRNLFGGRKAHQDQHVQAVNESRAKGPQR